MSCLFYPTGDPIVQQEMCKKNSNFNFNPSFMFIFIYGFIFIFPCSVITRLMDGSSVIFQILWINVFIDPSTPNQSSSQSCHTVGYLNTAWTNVCQCLNIRPWALVCCCDSLHSSEKRLCTRFWNMAARIFPNSAVIVSWVMRVAQMWGSKVSDEVEVRALYWPVRFFHAKFRKSFIIYVPGFVHDCLTGKGCPQTVAKIENTLLSKILLYAVKILNWLKSRRGFR